MAVAPLPVKVLMPAAPVVAAVLAGMRAVAMAVVAATITAAPRADALRQRTGFQ